MARKMRKFSDGGALGKYNRRMADIKKDFTKDSAGKSGKALEVLEAKRMQRTADAEDDRAKRTGGDRTATRAAERAAESNLTKTRKYGAPKAVSKAPDAKLSVTESLSVPKMDSSIGAKPAAKPVQKSVRKPVAAKPTRMGDQGFAYKKKDMPTIGDGVSTNRRYTRSGSQSGAASDGTAAQRLKNLGLKTDSGSSGTGKTTPATGGTLARGRPSGAPLISGTDSRAFAKFGDAVKNDPARAAKLAAMKKAAEAPGASRLVKGRYSDAVSSGMYAKGGKIMKYAKGGSTPPQPSAADRARSKKQLDELKKEKVTPENAAAIGRGNRSEASPPKRKLSVSEYMRASGLGLRKPEGYAHGGVTKEMPTANQMGSMNMAKGGKAKMKPAAKGKGKGNPFAATKFGAAMMKKGADAKGRAMPKFAKGGSIDGCAVKGKTKTSMLARGGAAKMRGRDHFGGASFKKGGKTC